MDYPGYIILFYLLSVLYGTFNETCRRCRPHGKRRWYGARNNTGEEFRRCAVSLPPERRDLRGCLHCSFRVTDAFPHLLEGLLLSALFFTGLIGMNVDVPARNKEFGYRWKIMFVTTMAFGSFFVGWTIACIFGYIFKGASPSADSHACFHCCLETRCHIRDVFQ